MYNSMLSWFKYLYTRRCVLSYKGLRTAKIDAVHLSYILPVPSLLCKLLRVKNHPNKLELNSIIVTLRKYFKNIYVTDYRYDGKNIESTLTIGCGNAVLKSIRKNSYFIYYATGSSADFQHAAVANEYVIAKDLYGMDVYRYFRLPDCHFGIYELASDVIYSIGNLRTAQTFHPSSRVRTLPGIVAGEADNELLIKLLVSKPVNRNELLWIGSKGMLHKGLHIAGSVCKILGCKITCIGISDDEIDDANNVLNIIGCNYTLYPYIEIGSAEWYGVIKRVTFVLGASVSEGMSTSLLTAARFGLIPISTDTCGVDCGSIVEFEDRITLVPRLADAVRYMFNMSDPEIIEMSKGLVNIMSANFSNKAFQDTFENYILNDLQEKFDL